MRCGVNWKTLLSGVKYVCFYVDSLNSTNPPFIKKNFSILPNLNLKNEINAPYALVSNSKKSMDTYEKQNIDFNFFF